jgi:tetratricopeptide (TPR) repeat protein
MRWFTFLALLVVLGCQSTALTSARLYLQQGETAKAREQLLKAAELTPNNPEVYLELARTYGLAGEFRAMATALDQCARLAPKPKLAQEATEMRRHYWAVEYNRGVTLATAAQSDLVGAKAAFQSAIAIDSTAQQAWRNLAFAQYQLQERGDAIASYERLVALAPADTAVLGNLSALCLQEARYDQAIEHLERLAALTPRDFRCQLNLGIARERAAAEAYQRAADAATDTAVARCIKETFAEHGQPLDDAVQVFDRVSDQAAPACRSQVNLGVALERSAEAAYRAAAELAPEAPAAHLGLGGFLYQQGRYEGARDAYARAMVLAPQDPDARYNLAMTYLQLDDDSHACALLEQLSAETPDNGSVWRQLSMIYARMDRVADARRAEDRARELGQ